MNFQCCTCFAHNSPDTVVGILNDAVVGVETGEIDLEFATRTSRNGPINLEVAGNRMLSDGEPFVGLHAQPFAADLLFSGAK